ncbi:MAG: DUF2797 domain-containing protein [Oceanospirillaceae bacterium]|nr:DUF2797 domain-containing protein [Oceanospirillaceae bacterium]
MCEMLSGNLSKMQTRLQDGRVHYSLELGGQNIDLNALLGRSVRLSFAAQINCVACGRKTNKSFNQGYCYPCFSTLAQCDVCIMSPEKCHFQAGTCREPAWGEEFCNREHFVYLANSTGFKVGITRGTQLPTRWLDQGAVQGLAVARVATRQISGLLETIFKQHVADKTNWRALLKADAPELDLAAKRDELFALCHTEIHDLQQRFGLEKVQMLDSATETRIAYPVSQYPQKINSHNLDKENVLEGILTGIKGQYWILDNTVINIRKYTGYHVELMV